MEFVARLMLAFAGVFSLLMMAWGGYYLVTALMSWRRPMDCGKHPASTRFAVLIAARNEELVIGSLINSLLMQDYPAKLYDIYVIPNHCTDNTARAAANFGAKVLECTVPVKSKGEVLRFAYQQLAGQGYDAFCVFDADNVAHPDFLKEMNNACCAGARAAQGYRDSKNPYDTAFSGCYSIYYWMMSRFHNNGKAGLGLSAMLGGTGFMVSAAALEKMGGWRTRTISEDLEMSVQLAMAEVKIWWVPRAITYDEQPLSYETSVKQRRRWTSGTIQLAQQYLPVLAERFVHKPEAVLLDMGATLLIPAYQVAALMSALCSALAVGCARPYFSLPLALGAFALNLLLGALGATVAAGLVLSVEHKWDRRLLKGLGCYWLFLLSWLPITVGCFFKKTTVWEEIRHTRNVAPQSIGKSGQALLP